MGELIPHSLEVTIRQDTQVYRRTGMGAAYRDNMAIEAGTEIVVGDQPVELHYDHRQMSFVPVYGDVENFEEKGLPFIKVEDLPPIEMTMLSPTSPD